MVDARFVDRKTFTFKFEVLEEELKEFAGHEEETEEFYMKVLSKISPLFAECSAVINKMQKICDVIDEQQLHFHWLTEPQLIASVMKNKESTGSFLGIALLAPMLERSLGNVLMAVASDVTKPPALLRDLLRHPGLETAFHLVLLFTARVLMGSPKSLNLRNIVWHGFASETEMGWPLLSVLAILIRSMSHEMTITRVPVRPYASFSSIAKIHSALFPNNGTPATIKAEMMRLVLDIGSIKTATMVHRLLSKFGNLFRRAMDLHEAKKFRDCLALLLIFWESAMRCVYVTVNDCPQRMLTAESDEFYTTFDTFLAREIAGSLESTIRINALPWTLGLEHAELLFEVLVLPGGPRLRDMLSHGQILDCPEEAGNFNLSCDVVILSLSHTLKSAIAISSTDLTGLEPQIVCPISYKPQYHPTTLLREEMTAALCELNSLQSLQSQCQKICHPNLEEKTEDLREEKNRWTLIVEELILKDTEEAGICTLYRSKNEYSAWAMMRQIIGQIRLGTKTIGDNLAATAEDWKEGKLRSRKRATVRRMLQALPEILVCYAQILERFLDGQMSMALKKPFNVDDEGDEKTEAALVIKWLQSKALHKLLKICQNICQNSQPTKNRWEESQTAVKSHFPQLLQQLLLATSDASNN